MYIKLDVVTNITFTGI